MAHRLDRTGNGRNSRHLSLMVQKILFRPCYWNKMIANAHLEERLLTHYSINTADPGKTMFPGQQVGFSILAT